MKDKFKKIIVSNGPRMGQTEYMNIIKETHLDNGKTVLVMCPSGQQDKKEKDI